jgi:hypothetical protein
MSDQSKQTCPVEREGEEPRHLFVVGQSACLCGARRASDFWFTETARLDVGLQFSPNLTQYDKP